MLGSQTDMHTRLQILTCRRILLPKDGDVALRAAVPGGLGL